MCVSSSLQDQTVQQSIDLCVHFLKERRDAASVVVSLHSFQSTCLFPSVSILGQRVVNVSEEKKRDVQCFLFFILFLPVMYLPTSLHPIHLNIQLSTCNVSVSLSVCVSCVCVMNTSISHSLSHVVVMEKQVLQNPVFRIRIPGFFDGTGKERQSLISTACTRMNSFSSRK